MSSKAALSLYLGSKRKRIQHESLRCPFRSVPRANSQLQVQPVSGDLFEAKVDILETFPRGETFERDCDRSDSVFTG